jgi:hypothetical protein
LRSARWFVAGERAPAADPVRVEPGCATICRARVH